MEKRTVLVTGIGGNVGQGIIRNINETDYPVRIIGCNIDTMSAGNHLVDRFYKVSFSYEDKFIAEIIAIVEKEKVDLIIPSTDYEVFYLSANKAIIPCQIACSGPEAAFNYLDKYLTYQFHKEKGIPFAETCLPSEYKGQYSAAIAKPRKGRGSRGLMKNIQTAEGLRDDEYLVQEMHEGTEITTAAYVSYLTGELLGIITLERSLENGATTFCKVVKEYDSELETLANNIVGQSDVKGSFNIQSIVTPDNTIAPFEINCRISGTNSIRSHFGFADVKYTLGELLYHQLPGPITVTDGIAYRYLADVIYPNGVNCGNNSDKFILF